MLPAIARARDRLGTLVVAVALYTAVHALWLAFGWGGAAWRTAIADGFILPAFLAACLAAARTARHPALDPAVRRAWRWLTATYGVLWLSNVLWTYRDLASDAPAWVADAGRALVLGSYGPLLAGLLAFPSAPRSRGERARFALDLTTALLGAGLVIWFAVSATAVATYPTPRAAALTLAVPVAHFAVLAALAALLLGRPDAGSRVALRLLAGGHAVSITASLVTVHIAGRGGAAPGDWVDALWMASGALLVLSADAQYRGAARRAEAGAAARMRVSGDSALPYVGVALGYAVLLIVSRPWWSRPLGVAVLCTAVITALVVARQVAALRDNRRLVAEQLARDAYFRSLIQHASDVVFVVDVDGTLRFASASAARVFGFDADGARGRGVFDFLHPDDVAAARGALRAVATRAADAPAVPQPLVLRVRHVDGGWRVVEATAGLLPGGGGQLVLNVRDVSERVEAEAALRESQRALATLLSNLPGMAYRCRNDADWTMEFVSDGCAELTGYAPDDLTGRGDAPPRVSYASRIHPEDRGGVWAAVQDAVATGAPFQLVYRIVTADGRERHVWEQGRAVTGEDGQVRALEGIVLDVTERTRAQAQLAHQAFHDPLTGLANRALFRDRVEQALARAARRGDVRVAVLFLDLDDFKAVNDSLGHAAGDELLVTVAERLLNATRGCDTVARLGGDEFAVLLEAARDGDTQVVASRILSSLARPVTVGARELVVAGSVGIATAHAGDGAEELLRNADVAMYRAKARGKGTYELFAPAMHAEAHARLALESDLRHALDRGQLRLEYQPIFALATEEVVGVEALVRWDHPERGPVSPATFIPIAEASGVILPLGRWVLGEACRQAAAWRRAGAGELYVAVNLSGRQLQDPQLVADVALALAGAGLEPGALLLEITEGVVMHDTEASLRRLHELKALGVRLAIDDFGTGFSSLAYLQRFPVDVLKIDRLFVDGVAEGGSNAALTRAIVTLGETLSLHTVAEGIETAAQRDALLALGCSLGQGYLLARPLPAAALAPLVLGAPARAAAIA